MKLFDGFMNFAAGLGILGKDKSASNGYAAPITDLLSCENTYRTSAFGRAVVDIPAGDMTRAWRLWSHEPEEMWEVEKKLGVRRLTRDGIAIGSRQGGAGLYIGLKGVDGDELAEPLDVNKVQKGDLEYLTLFGRNELSVVEYEDDPLSPRYRKGKLYSINRGNGSALRIHWSRFAWFGALPTSSETAEVQDGWDDPVYTTLQPLIEGADSALANMLAMIHEARVDVLKIPNLASYFEDDESERRLTQRIMTTQSLKSTIHMMVVDATEEHETKSTSFTGVVDVFRTSLESLSGAADIPITRFLGVSPKGLNNGGESDLKNYYDSVAARQENELNPALSILDAVLYKHVTGENPERLDTAFEWNPLWQQSAKEAAETNKAKAETNKIYHEMGVFEPEFFAAAVLSQVQSDEVYPGLPGLIEEMADESDALFVVPPEDHVEKKPGSENPSDDPNATRP